MIIEVIPRKNDTASHPTDFCEILIGKRNIIDSGIFFGVTNIRANIQLFLKSLKGYFTKCCKKLAPSIKKKQK